jgi:hypothetical protein
MRSVSTLHFTSPSVGEASRLYRASDAGGTEGLRALRVKRKSPEALLETSAGLTPSAIALARADSSPIEGERE